MFFGINNNCIKYPKRGMLLVKCNIGWKRKEVQNCFLKMSSIQIAECWDKFYRLSYNIYSHKSGFNAHILKENDSLSIFGMDIALLSQCLSKSFELFHLISLVIFFNIGLIIPFNVVFPNATKLC